MKAPRPGVSPAASMLAAIADVSAQRHHHLEQSARWTHELRERIAKAYEAGVPKKAIAEAAGVSRPTVDKWLEEK